MSKLSIHKQTKVILSLVITFVLFSIYLFFEFYSVKKESENYLKKSLILKYDIYLKLSEENNKTYSINVKNRDYMNSNEFIEEFKKSTPLYTNNLDKELPKYNLIFKYFEKDSNNKDIKNYIKELKKEVDNYIVKYINDKQIILFGKVFNKGYVLIYQNRNDINKISSRVNSLFLLILIFFLGSIALYFYIFYLKKNMLQVCENEKRNYEELSEETKKIAFEDTLTKAASRLKFDETLKDLIQIASRFEEQRFSLILIDIDNFKRVNDTYGHDYGDIVLKNVATCIKRNIRKSDTFARWGGEEFIVLSPFSDLEHGSSLAEKLRKQITQIQFEKIEFISCSFGVVEFLKGDDEESIVKRADELLYKAKENGKNRVEWEK